MSTPPPPLPTPWRARVFDGRASVYTTAQLQEHAAACVAAETARIKALFDAARADHELCWPGEFDTLYDACFKEPV